MLVTFLHLCIILTCTLWLCEKIHCQSPKSYHGFYVGDFPIEGSVEGTVHIVDENRLLVTDFLHKEENSESQFYVKFLDSKESSNSPDSNGVQVDSMNKAEDPQMAGNTVILTIPEKHSTAEVSLLYVWSNSKSQSLGSVQFKNVQVPTTRYIGELQGRAHGVVGDVTIINHKQVFISEFSYDGTAPETVFLVGKDTPNSNGRQIPDELGQTEQLASYYIRNITLTLPGNLSIFDIEYLSVYCVLYDYNFGDVIFPKANELVVPPYLGDDLGTRNCESLAEFLNAAWKVHDSENSIEFELEVSLKDKESYVAFGVSGSSTESSMIGADVTVLYYTSDYEMTAVDYYLSNYSLCTTNGSGACPDSVRSDGVNDVTFMGSSFNDGVTTVKFSRSINTQDPNDKPLVKESNTQIIWAIGPMTLENELVLKHVERIGMDGNPGKSIMLWRNPVDNCAQLKGRVKSEDVKPWVIPALNGVDGNTVFNVAVGPPGGMKGYQSRTGVPSWGLVYYINGLLMPEIHLERGRNYTFIIKTGNNIEKHGRYHPFYIADDAVGGYSRNTSIEMKNLGAVLGMDEEGRPNGVGQYCEYRPKYGVDQTMNSETFEEYSETLELACEDGEPAILHFRPDEGTLDELYYQCYSHKYMGWKIHVLDVAYAPDDPPMYTDDIGNFDIGQSNHACLQLNEDFLIGWEISDTGLQTMVNFTFILPLPIGRYVAFGIGGSFELQMVGGNVIVVSRGDQLTATDYSLTAYKQCFKGVGVCPNNSAGALEIVEETEQDGIFMVKVLKSDFRNMQRFLDFLYRDQSVIWAMGPYNRQSRMIQKHDTRIDSVTWVNFGMAYSTRACPANLATVRFSAPERTTRKIRDPTFGAGAVEDEATSLVAVTLQTCLMLFVCLIVFRE